MSDEQHALGVAFAKRVGERIRSLREASAQSQQAVVDGLREPEWRTLVTLGGQITWPQTTLAKVERGERQLSLREAAILSKYFGVDIAELVPGLQSSAKAARESELLALQRYVRDRLRNLADSGEG